MDERTAAETLGPPVCERAPDLLLERQEQTGTGHEDETPEGVEGAVGPVGQGLVRDDQEDVRGECRDHQAATNREGSLGHRVAGLLDECSARSFTRGDPIFAVGDGRSDVLPESPRSVPAGSGNPGRRLRSTRSGWVDGRPR